MKFGPKVGVIVAVAAGLLAGCSFGKGPEIASVNGQPIYQQDLEQAMKQEILIHSLGTGKGTKQWKDLKANSALYRKYEKGTLQGLIDQMLVDQKARQLHLTVTNAEIHEAISHLSNGFLNEEDLDKALRQDGLTLAELEKQVREQILFDKLEGTVVARDQVTRKQVEDYYNSHKKDYIVPEQVHLAQIFTPHRKEIEEAYRALTVEGKTWDQAVALYSKDQYSIYKNGDIGLFIRGQLQPKVDNAVWAAKAGQIVGPIQVPGKGWYLFRVIKFLPKHPDSLKDVYFSIYHQLSEERMNKVFTDFMSEITKGARIEYYVSWLRPKPEKARRHSKSADAEKGEHSTAKATVKNGRAQEASAKGA